MFAKLIFISTIFSFVYVRTVQCCESQTSAVLDSSRSDTDMNSHPTKTMEQKLMPEYKLRENWQMNRATVASLHLADILPENHEITHHDGMKHPKKRATNNKQNQQIDLRPGCCG